MTYYSPEDIEKAREVDLLTYLQQYEPENLVKYHGNVYCCHRNAQLFAYICGRLYGKMRKRK